MKRALLITQRFLGTPDSGGNRAHNSVMNSIRSQDSLEIDVLVISFDPDFSSNSPNIHVLSCKSLMDIVLFSRRIASLVSSYDKVIYDGFGASLAYVICGTWLSSGVRSALIHHNLEANLSRSGPKKIFFRCVQSIAVSRASLNIFFSERDRHHFSESTASLVSLPISRAEISNIYSDGLDCLDRGEDGGGYIAIPSNFGYIENINGLRVFYKNYRRFFADQKIKISTPNFSDLPSDVKDLVDFWADDVVSFPDQRSYFQFVKSSSAVVIPIFSGSGIQLKALDAVMLHDCVYSGRFIVESNVMFSSFISLEEISDVVKEADLFGPFHGMKGVSGDVFCIDDAIHRFIDS